MESDSVVRKINENSLFLYLTNKVSSEKVFIHLQILATINKWAKSISSLLFLLIKMGDVVEAKFPKWLKKIIFCQGFESTHFNFLK